MSEIPLQTTLLTSSQIRSDMSIPERREDFHQTGEWTKQRLTLNELGQWKVVRRDVLNLVIWTKQSGI